MLSTVTDKGQVTLPKAIRDRLGILPLQGAGPLRGRVRTRGAAGLFGLLARPDEAARSLEEIDAGIAEAVAERARRKR